MRPAAGSMSISVVAVAAAVVAAAATDAASGTCQSDLGRCFGQGQRDVAVMAACLRSGAAGRHGGSQRGPDRCVQSYGRGCRPSARDRQRCSSPHAGHLQPHAKPDGKSLTWLSCRQASHRIRAGRRHRRTGCQGSRKEPIKSPLVGLLLDHRPDYCTKSFPHILSHRTASWESSRLARRSANNPRR